MPHGSVLGPLLFLVLIGDIDKEITSTFVSSFAEWLKVEDVETTVISSIHI